MSLRQPVLAGSFPWRLLAGVLLAFCLASSAHALVAVPPLKSRVTDLTGTLDAATRHSLETRLADLEKARGSQLAVLMVASTRPESIEQYGLRVAEAWKLGRKGVDDGALLLVAKDDRAVRIEVGYGLEGAIPDAVAKRVIEELVLPRFKAGQYAAGVDAGVAALERVVRGEALPAPEKSLTFKDLEDFLSTAMVFIFVVGGLLRALLGVLVGAAVAGVVAFIGSWMLLGSLVAALFAGVIAFVLTLFGVSNLVGGGGGGGFGGGGGGFGGGGASGRW